MKIVQFSTSDLAGGAAVSAYRLHKGLIRHGVDTRMLVVNRFLTEPTIETITSLDRLKVRVRDWWNRRATTRYKKLLSWSLDGGVVNPLRYAFVREADAYIVHWVGLGFMDSRRLEGLLRTGKPVLLVFHDLFFMTGGCHYPMRCDGFQRDCTDCPLIGGGLHKDAMRQLRKKERVFQKYPNLNLIAGSEWTASKLALSRATRGLPIEVIPMPMDDRAMRLVPRAYARELLGIPTDSKVLLFGANDGTSNPYKGWDYLSNALSRLNLSEWTVMTVGNRGIAKEKLPFQVKERIHYDRLYDPTSLGLLYNAADLFIMPSIAETFGKMAYEAISSGTPVVCFRAGGLGERMTEGVNAWIAEPAEDEERMTLNLVEALRKAMKASPSMDERKAMRDAILKDLSGDVVTERFLSVISKVLSR